MLTQTSRDSAGKSGAPNGQILELSGLLLDKCGPRLTGHQRRRSLSEKASNSVKMSSTIKRSKKKSINNILQDFLCNCPAKASWSWRTFSSPLFSSPGKVSFTSEISIGTCAIFGLCVGSSAFPWVPRRLESSSNVDGLKSSRKNFQRVTSLLGSSQVRRSFEILGL